MPSISKIRLTNVVYEEGNKRYNDEVFLFDGHNGAILLENGGGKTVLIQTALQAVLPHVELADRKIKNTLQLENAPAHIAIEWIDHDKPRRYVVTAVTLFLTKHGLDSLRYVYEYDANDPNGIEGIPFVRDGREGKRPAERGEMQDYYSLMKERSSIFAHTFQTIKEFKAFIEKQYHIIASEWDSIVKINSTEGGVEAFFDDCKSTNQLFDRLLIPTVEDSIVGHDYVMFADMFEKQHASFKNYKKLKETIEENKKIQQKLDEYVLTFEQLHNKEQAYLKTKQQVKGVWTLIGEQKRKTTSEQIDAVEMMTKWEVDNNLYTIKADSYDILVEKDKLDQLTKDYQQAQAHLADKEESWNNHKTEYYSLKLAGLKLDKKQQEEQLTHVETQLALFEKTDDLLDYQAQLQEASQALLGFYLDKIEKINKEKQGVSYQLNPLLEQSGQAQTNKEKLLKEIKEVEKLLSGIQATIDGRTSDMDRIKQQILANPEQEKVSEELPKWQERSQFLDEEIIRLEQQIRLLSKQEEESEQQRDAYIKEQTSIEMQRNTVSFQLDQMNERQTALVELLAGLRPQWANLDDVYTSQQTIETRLTEQIEKLRRERNNLLSQERLAYRFVDDYQGQEVFFADAFLEEQLTAWKNQFDYLITGVEYMQTLEEAEQLKLQNFSLWPITLITTNKSKQQLLDKLNHNANRLQYPITVLTTEEALAMNESKHQAWVAPKHWGDNVEVDRFNEWKQQMKQDALQITKKREIKEQESTSFEDARKALYKFIEDYPYERYVKVTTELSEWTNKLEEIIDKVGQERERNKKIRSEKDSNRVKIKNFTNEMQGLDTKITSGLQYQGYEKEVSASKGKQEDALLRHQKLESEHTKRIREIQGLEEQISECKERINELDVQLGTVNQDDDYQSVQMLTPVFSNKSKTVIKTEIVELNRKIDRITVTQGEWLAKQKAAKDAIDRLNKQVEEIWHQHGNLQDNMDFPSDGEHLLQKIWDKMESIQAELSGLNDATKQALSAKENQKGTWQTKVKQFRSRFGEQAIIQFGDSTDVVAEKLKLESNRLEERKTFIDQQMARIQKELANIEAAERELELHIESHHFNAPDVQEIPLTAEQAIDFHYQRKKYAKSLVEDMKQARQSVEHEQKQVGKSRNKVRDFCRNEISDIKLQQMAITGVESKQTYYDLVEFKKNMFSRIDRITNYANEHIRKSDEDLQLFINQIHTHLKMVVEELKQIPNKTRVKVSDDWKQVFTFSIPEWEEEVGKSRIRDHVEWILKQLESERFINEQGIQDESKVRKEIEMWLQSKQLLQVVMNNEVMKVSCRKVTNDNKVTSRSFSWEQSNVWSGGEKWSKNMTLFLGILNYVAEKKQHLQTNMKRHRAVILDNPFGKASSDHVLSPVFFVAEQLGFQIIALTAHAEGKFLQDYFPVIYSCRLRATADRTKKVMTKEKWLHHAYFQDHEPVTMDRLGEVEQMNLFE
ncbi:coiled-coil domain-containing protein [Aquibacillus kalidii]|uniref:hypothetical protein n=1 Tax=Aquibacillus kalidii TaxID=2762597 RepID=UPI0016464FD2|nr:hypothetical protein [Aquibacillus kalidii]